MPLEKKKSPYFDELSFKRFSIIEVESEFEGIQSPVFIPSEEVLDFSSPKVVSLEEAEVVYHDDATKIYELPNEVLELERKGDEKEEVWSEENLQESFEKPEDFVTCPKCQSLVPVYRSTKDHVICPSCGNRIQL